MKNLKKFITLFLTTTLITVNTFGGKPETNVSLSSNEELSKNTQHNQQIIKQLPPEIWAHVATFLPPQDRSHFAQTCKDFYALERSVEVPVSLRLTNSHLASFESLLKYLSNHTVVELDLFMTNINDEQLANILNEIGGNLRTLGLRNCYNLHNFEAIRNCTQLQALYLSFTKINDTQLTEALNQIGKNLRTLDLNGCKNLNNFEAIKYCIQLQKLGLFNTYINDDQLASILNEIGENLKTLWLGDCKNLHNFEAIKYCTQLQELDLSCTKITDRQLTDILKQIGENLRKLNLYWCFNLNNFEAIKNCIHYKYQRRPVSRYFE